MAESRKPIEMTSLDMGVEKAKQEKASEDQDEDPVSCISSNGVKTEQLPAREIMGNEKVEKVELEKKKQKKTSVEDLAKHGESEQPMPYTSFEEVKAELPPASECSPTSGATPNLDMTYLDMGERKVEKTKQVKSSEDADEYEETEKPMPCRPTSSDTLNAEWLPTPESSPTSTATSNKEMTYIHKVEEKVLEIRDNVKKENLSDEGPNESRQEEPMLFTSAKSEAENFPAQKSICATAAAKSIGIEMTYLHKKDEEKIDNYQVLTIDDEVNRNENVNQHEELPTPCISSTGVIKAPPDQECSSASGASATSENLIDTDEYDEVIAESENPSDASKGGYEEPLVVNSERLSVPPPGGYEEPDVVNSERPPVTPPGGYEEPDVVNSERPPVTPPGGYEEPHVVNSERPPVPTPGGYEEPDVVNSERPPVTSPGGYEEPVVVNSERPPVTPPGGYEEPDVVNSERPPVPTPGGYEEPDVVNSERPPVTSPGGYEEPVVVNSERPPVTPPGGYEEPHVVNSERPPVTPPGGYEEPLVMNSERPPVPLPCGYKEPDVVNSERLSVPPPGAYENPDLFDSERFTVPGRSCSPGVASSDMSSIYQELQ